MAAKKNILIVEDNESLRALLCMFFHDAVWEATNGFAAYYLAKKTRPDLIVTDIDLPLCDGIELTKRIRADDDLKMTPIIVITGTDSATQMKAYEAGASVVFEKPPTARALEAAIASFLGS